MRACVVVDVAHSHHQKTQKTESSTFDSENESPFHVQSPALWECWRRFVKVQRNALAWSLTLPLGECNGAFFFFIMKIIPLFLFFAMLPYGSCRHTASRAQNWEKSSRSQQPRLKFNNFSLVWRHPAQAQEADEWIELQSILVVMDREKAKRLARRGQQNTTITMNLCGRFNQSSLWESHFSH